MGVISVVMVRSSALLMDISGKTLVLADYHCISADIRDIHASDMYLINKEDNAIEPIKEITFKSAGFKERQHLQEWIAKNPESLGEELLIIQKEFSDFDDTNERLDLLALDKKGNLVIIENKLDDTGRDVVWQALKYASYFSSLNGKVIIDIFNGSFKIFCFARLAFISELLN